MNESFDISVHPNIIEKIHNQLILTTYSKEYAHVIKYKTSNNNNNNDDNNDNDTSCQSLVFNANDLMYCIFQLLSYKVKIKDKDNDLVHCSLVNSHWLYHVFNANSCYQIDFTMLWNEEKGEAVINKIQSRLWQRVIKVKSVNYDTTILKFSTLSKDKSHDKLLSKISMLSNVEKIHCQTNPGHAIVIKALIQQCRKNIKHFDVSVCNIQNFAYDKYVLVELIIQMVHYQIDVLSDNSTCNTQGNCTSRLGSAQVGLIYVHAQGYLGNPDVQQVLYLQE